METTNSKGVHANFFYLLKSLPNATKEDIVYAYSSQTTTSLRDFYANHPLEYQAMINDLEHKITINRLKNEKLIKDKRSAVLKRIQKYGIDTTEWSKVNDFLLQPKIAGKKLYDMSIDEMNSLIKKLESILKKKCNV
jgi:hypothetical protein